MRRVLSFLMAVVGTSSAVGLSPEKPLIVPSLTIAGPSSGSYEEKYAAGSVTQYVWKTSLGQPLCLYSFSATGRYVGQPLCFSSTSANANSTSGEITLGSPITQTTTAAPASAHSINYFNTFNNGIHGGIGSFFGYSSTANDSSFDVGFGGYEVFDPMIPAGAVKLDTPKQGMFLGVVTPATNLPGVGTSIAEWNIINRGCDPGGFRNSVSAKPALASCSQNSLGLAVVPEVADATRGGAARGTNDNFGIVVGPSGGSSNTQTNQGSVIGSITNDGQGRYILIVTTLRTGLIDVGQAVTGGTVGSTASALNNAVVTPDAVIASLPVSNPKSCSLVTPCAYPLKVSGGKMPSAPAGTTFQLGPFAFGKFYSPFNAEPEATAGETGRSFYAGGTATGVPALQPWSPFQVEFAYKHGIDTTQAVFADGAALRLATGQKILFDTSSETGVSASAVGKLLISAGTSVVLLDNSGLTLAGSKTVTAGVYIETLSTPASSSAKCTKGQFSDDANYHYVCAAPNHWRRVALSDF